MNEKGSNESFAIDWDRIDAMSDEDIDFSDIPEQGEEFFRRALLRLPDGRILIRAAIDRELADWLRSEGEEQDAIVNLALRELRERRRSA